MLVISRRTQQAVRVGESIITILKVDKGQVKIGIKAPENVKILRMELENSNGKS